MTFAEKIDEWVKEAETSPGSALMILKLISGRLRDLTIRNEELLAENISLQNGTHVEEYQKRIIHLEFQLDLLKRRFGADADTLVCQPVNPEVPNILLYNAHGRFIRLEPGSSELSGVSSLGRLVGELAGDGELPRLLSVSAEDELLLLFSSGRVGMGSVKEIPALLWGGNWGWEQAALSEEPHPGEILACAMPLSRLPLSNFILQASRRGCVKKVPSTMSESILANHYLGRGAIQKADQVFSVALAMRKDRLVLVTHEGRLVVLEESDLSFAVEERIRLDGTDHVVGAFVLHLEETLLCLTQTGKVIQREGSTIESSKTLSARGQMLISAARLAQGTRFIGAVAVRDDDKLVVLDGGGNLSVHSVEAVRWAGLIKAEGLILSLGVILTSNSRNTRL